MVLSSPRRAAGHPHQQIERHQDARLVLARCRALGRYIRSLDAALDRTTMTRAELMRHALTQALRRVHVGAKKLKLDEETRWQIGGEAVEELRRE